MAGKTLGERIARLEVYYAEIPGHLKDIKALQEKQNGRLGALERWQQRIIGAGLLVVSVIPLTAIAIAVLA